MTPFSKPILLLLFSTFATVQVQSIDIRKKDNSNTKLVRTSSNTGSSTGSGSCSTTSSNTASASRLSKFFSSLKVNLSSNSSNSKWYPRPEACSHLSLTSQIILGILGLILV